MFFVCLVTLDPKYNEASMITDHDIPLIAQEEEIAKIEWMDVDDYSNQELWSKSPLYQEVNAAMKRVVDEMTKDVSDTKGDQGPHVGMKEDGMPTSGIIRK